MHKSLDKLYAGIEEAGTGRSGVGELRALAALSANLYTMVSVAPWLDEEYGSARELCERIRKVAAALVRRLERETDAVERVRGVNALFVLSNTAVEYEQKMLDLASSVLAESETGHTGPEAAVYEAEVCRMMCNCYCLMQDEALAADARAILARWTAPETAADERVLPAEVVLARCEAAACYADYTGDESFRNRFHGGAETAQVSGPEALFRLLELQVRNGSSEDSEALCSRIGKEVSADSGIDSQAYFLAARAVCELLWIKNVHPAE